MGNKATLITEKRVDVKVNKTEGIENYDIDNAYPQRVQDIIEGSGTGKLCTKFLCKFIFGGGWRDKALYDIVVNRKGETADKLLRKAAKSMGTFGGVALHVNYNALYEKTELSIIPFKHVRKTTEEDKDHPNMYAVYDDWDKVKSKSILKNKIDYIYPYSPDINSIKEQVIASKGWAGYKGQLIYFTEEQISGEYPLAPGDAVLEDMLTDAKTKNFKLRNISTNFMASHVIELDEFMESAGDDGETISAEDQREDFLQALTEFQGDDNALKILLLEKRAGGTPVTIKDLKIQDVDKLYQYTEDSVISSIIRHYLIPPILLLQVPGKLGNSTEINQAVEYYNMITQDQRLLMEELFKEALTGFRGLTVNDFTVIPATDKMREPIKSDYLQYVTKNQILASLGLPETEESVANVKPLYEALGVGGLQALVGVLTNIDLTTEQKVAALKIIFTLNDQQASELSKGKTPAGGGIVA